MIKPKTAFAMVIICLLVGISVKAQAPIIPLQDQNIHSIVAYFANQYAVSDALMDKVMECESNGDQNTISDQGLSKGVFQIQQETWNRFTKEMGETLNRNSSMDQAKVASWAFANGHAGEWTTYEAIKHGGSYTFYDRLDHKKETVHCKLST